MPETRYTEVYKDGVLIDKEPYEVSDEELEEEANKKILNDLLDMVDGDIKVPLIGKALKALIKLRK